MNSRPGEIGEGAAAAFPAWLPELRAAGYRLDGLPPARQEAVRHAVASRGIELWRPGARWPTAREDR